jgi:predicted RNA binding protein YcfA (HicA-like mRNA interferase family)
MPRLRRLSGQDVIRALSGFGFRPTSQRGSHIKLLRLTPEGERQTLTIPNHRELDPGTLRAIFRQASRYVSAEQLRSLFYHE